MKRLLLAVVLLSAWVRPVHAYIEVPYTLGRCIAESSTVVLAELTRVNKEKNLLIFKKVRDLKGTHAANEIKHNIGQRGFHEREWKNVMAWAEPGKKAIFMYNGDASETCIDRYWYQAYREGEWWGMSHAEPFLLRTFFGDPEQLAGLIEKMVDGQEVVVPCLADTNKSQLHERKGKLQRLRASLKRIEYNPRRDFLGWGLEGDVEEFETVKLFKESSDGWRFLPAAKVKGDSWTQFVFPDLGWRSGKAPIGYGEEELGKREGTAIEEKGVDFLFRRAVDVPLTALSRRGAVFTLSVASDNRATVYLNGELLDEDPEADHEFAYWNREIEVPLKLLRAGRNVFAFRVNNGAMSSDLYLDAELAVQFPLPKPTKPVTVAATNPKPSATPNETPSTPSQPAYQPEPRDPQALQVDKEKKTVTIACKIAPRKLPNLDQQYPIEVVATFAAPRGQKAHETIVDFRGVRPSDVHAGLVSLGLSPGKPAIGENTQAAGPEVRVWIEIPSGEGTWKRLSVEQCLVQKATGEAMIPLKWHFTGSVSKQPDPEKDEQVYGADVTGTLLSLFPVTDACVLQTQLTMQDEPRFKLETNPRVLPAEGTAARLVIAAPSAGR